MAVVTAITAEFLLTKFDEALFRWIVDTSKPYRKVEHEFFEDVFSVASRHVTLTIRRTIQR